MTTHIARNDALIVQQITILTPTATNAAVYDVKLNTKVSRSYIADVSATVQEIVEGLQTLLDANADNVPEIGEVTWTENNTTLIGTGPTTGMPFTVLDGPGSGTWASISTTAGTPKSPNHWIAENFDSGSLPGNNDTVYVTGLSQTQSIKWGLDQSAFTLTNLHIRADSEAEIGLPDINSDSQLGSYYQAAYREAWLKIGATNLYIGDGIGNGSGRIKLNLGTVTCNATIYKTGSNRSDQDEAPVQLLGGSVTSTLQVVSGDVDIAMSPGSVGTWLTSVITGSGITRFGSGAVLNTASAVVEVGGSATVETRSACTTLRTRDQGRVRHYAGNVATLDLAGGDGEVQATAVLTITQLNGYAGKTLDLSKCDSAITITDMTIYATPDNPFTILDYSNRLVMTNPASCPYGAQSLIIKTGSNRTVKVA